MAQSDADVVVVGSGFGGSVAALRLTEKGYRVIVLEAGRRFRDEDFAASPWQVQRLLWAPRLGLRGILRPHVRRHVLALSGAGVGGGSLAYAGVHYRPGNEVFDAEGWDRTVNWAAELAPYYARAERMLGTTTVPRLSEGDLVLRQVAEGLGAARAFHLARVGVHFGPCGQTVADPYFGGEGPNRSGCTGCGQCTIGCRVGAKNTLVKNYLYLAEQAGARIRPLTTVTALEPLPSGGWRVHTARSGAPVGRRDTLTAHQVVLAAGAWGTAELLHRSRRTGALPALSRALGTRTCTNREVILAASAAAFDVGPGVAISSAARISDSTLLQLCRVGHGSHPMAGALVPLARGVAARTSALLRAPLNGFGRRTALLLAMEGRDSTLTSHYRWRHLTFRPSPGLREPARLPLAETAAQHYARHIGGDAYAWGTNLLGLPFTAHLLGGCPIGSDPHTAVVDPTHRVHGYPTLHVADASLIPANLGLNPSLTITAMAERAFTAWPAA